MKKSAILFICCCFLLTAAAAFAREFGGGRSFRSGGNFGGGFNRSGGFNNGGGSFHEPQPAPHPQPQPHPRPAPPGPKPHPGPHPVPPHPAPVPPGPGPHPMPPPGPHPYPVPVPVYPYPYYPYPFYPYYAGVGVYVNLNSDGSTAGYNDKVAKEYDELNALEQKKYYYSKSAGDLLKIGILNEKYAATPAPTVTVTFNNTLSYAISNITISVKLSYGSTDLLLNDIFYAIDGSLAAGMKKTCKISLKDVKTALPASAKATVTITKMTDSKGKTMPSEEFTQNDQKRMDELKKKLKVTNSD